MSGMSGGKRKSRKPQKWEDYVADEEQLASIEKELEKEEKARMLNLDDESSKDKESDEDLKEEKNEITKDQDDCPILEEEMPLEVTVTQVGEEKDAPDTTEKMDVVENSNGKEKNETDVTQPAPASEADQMIGECKSCGIQLRDWSSTHSHLRFHRLSYVPYCINWSSCDAPQAKRITCQVCQRHCQTKEVLAYHAYTEHYRSDVKMCPFCSVTFKSMKEFQEHLDFDVISLHCYVCDAVLNEEHKYYLHVADCIAKTYPDATSVACHICIKVTDVKELHAHLLKHSTLVNLTGHLSQRTKRRPVIPPKSENSRQQQTHFRPFLCEICDRRFVLYSEFKRHLYSHSKSRSFVCTYCGRSYCQKNTLIVHLYSYHNASLKAEEITPKEDTAQRTCDLCGRSGFLNDELLVRHYILRCSQRNNLQLSFATIVSSVAKKLNMCFSETISHASMHTYLKLGSEAWEKIPCVHNYLEVLLDKNEPTVPTGGRRESSEFSDVQLLMYLDHFEEKNRDQDKELEFLLNIKTKDGSPAQDIPGLDEIQTINPTDSRSTGEEGEDSRASPSFLSSNTRLSGKDTGPFANGDASGSSVLNLKRLMQYLGKNPDKRKSGEEVESKDEGNQIDICLVTSTTNTQVTITPAGKKLQDMKPPKIARSVSHKPSAEEIQYEYPGVTVLKSVDFSRIPSLLLEMQEMMENKTQREMDKKGILPADVQRLEIEAQLLREAEPFYLNQDPKWKLPTRNGKHGNFTQQIYKNIPVPDYVTEFISRTKDNCDPLNFKHGINGSSFNSIIKIKSGPSDKEIHRLLNEAKELNIPEA